MTKSSQKKANTVGIIGCGWLGQALAKSLQQEKVPVLATSGNSENVNKLNLQNINAVQCKLPAPIDDLSKHAIFRVETLIIAIPPQFKKGQVDYADNIKAIVKSASLTGVVRHIILVSSTGIYNGLQGEVHENSSLDLSQDKVRILHEAEQHVLTFNGLGHVIRLAGLVGPERHPGKFLLAKKVINNAQARVNLIHQADAVGLLMALLNTATISGVFNGVSDCHVSKKQYYQCAAKSLGLPLPSFDDVVNDKSNSAYTARIVNGDKAKRILDYSFVYPDLLAWL